jgi:hypothetical protein
MEASPPLGQHDVVEAWLGVLDQLAEARPLGAEFGRVMRRRELLAVRPLNVVADTAAVVSSGVRQ